MAKDKSDKKPKGDKVASGISNEFATPSAAPAGGDEWNLESEGNVGKVLLITPLSWADVETKKYGTKKVIVSDIVEINEKKPEKSVEHSGVYVFGGYIIQTLKSYVGTQRMPSVLVQKDDPAAGRGYHWELGDATPDQVAACSAYLKSLDPFAQK